MVGDYLDAVASMPARSSKGRSSGARPRKSSNNDIGSRLSPRASTCSRNAALTATYCTAAFNATDSPQPHALVWFGLLNTKRACSLSRTKSISVPIKNKIAFGLAAHSVLWTL